MNVKICSPVLGFLVCFACFLCHTTFLHLFEASKTRIKKLAAASYTILPEVSSKLSKQCRPCIFHLILVGIPSSLVLSVKNKGVGLILLNKQNLLNMIKVISWRSLTSKHFFHCGRAFHSEWCDEWGEASNKSKWF